MKKLLLVVFMAMMTFVANAQSPVNFKLSTVGTFISEEGKDFIVVPFEGKNAHQIFQTICTSVSKLYKNPDKVMSVVDDASISVRAYADGITYKKDIVQSYYLGGYYKVDIEIKDGRIKITTSVDSDVAMSNGAQNTNFFKMVRSWAKDGVFKEKFLKQVSYTEVQMNTIVNDIIGANKPKDEDNW